MNKTKPATASRLACLLSGALPAIGEALEISLAIVSRRTGIPAETLTARSRGIQDIADARHTVRWMVMRLGFGLSETARATGYDHSAISNSRDTIENLRSVDADLKRVTDECFEEFRAAIADRGGRIVHLVHLTKASA